MSIDNKNDTENTNNKDVDSSDWLSVGDVVYFKEWWCHSHCFAEVIEFDGFFFRVKFFNYDLERENVDDEEWFKPRHIDAVLRVNSGRLDRVD